MGIVLGSLLGLFIGIVLQPGLEHSLGISLGISFGTAVGLIVAGMAACTVFLKYARLWAMQHQLPQPDCDAEFAPSEAHSIEPSQAA